MCLDLHRFPGLMVLFLYGHSAFFTHKNYSVQHSSLCLKLAEAPCDLCFQVPDQLLSVVIFVEHFRSLCGRCLIADAALEHYRTDLHLGWTTAGFVTAQNSLDQVFIYLFF